MRPKVLLVVSVAAMLALLAVFLIRSVWQTAPKNPPTNAVAAASNPMPSSQVDSEGPKATNPQRPPLTGQPQRENVSDAQSNWTSEPLPPGSNLQEQVEELARRRGVPLTVLTQQLATELSNALFQALSGPVDFHGKAVDETGAPVGGAIATFRCLIFPESQFTTNVLTDANGLFTLHGIQGQALSVTVAKQGYDEVPGTNEHHFAYYGVPKGFQPDPYHPVTFLLRKKE